ncbi:MAG: DMT family transporter [Deltaproteobacteria bacterium]|nr:DMT family transporter [Deltaproteobacteria bacterium]
MTIGIFILVVVAAFFHALWNFAARKVTGNLVIIWLALFTGCLFLLPGIVVLVSLGKIHLWIPSSAVGYVIATGLIHGIYFGLLSRTYEKGEISVVYPILRGSGIGLTALLAWLILNEEISPVGLTGIALIFSGILLMGIPFLRRGGEVDQYRLALCVGTSIAAYSLVDKVGVSKMTPVLYIWFMFLVAAAVLSPTVMKQYRGEVLHTARANIGYIMLIGVGSIGTYLMILFALQLAPVSYIVAAREFSVVIGALLGVTFLKERMTILKATAIICITLGLFFIKAG